MKSTAAPREARELDRRDRAAAGGLLEGVARVHDLAGERDVLDARELDPLDVAHHGHPRPARGIAHVSHTQPRHVFTTSSCNGHQ